MEKKIFPFLVLIILMQCLVLVVQSSGSAEIDKTTEVSWVIDGDTFDTASGDRIRLADVDAPEKGESGYYDAKNFLIGLVYDKTVYLDIDDIYGTDKYDRLVCVVYVDYNSTHFKNVNKALLVAGVAVIKNYYNEFNPYTWTLYSPKEAPPPPQPSDSTPPSISVLSPKNKTYAISDISLTFIVDESVSWTAYSLDNKGNVAITGNTTLFGLSDGSHSLVVYAEDLHGNLASEIIYFTIDKKTEPQQADTFPSTSQLYMIVIVIAVIAGITGFVVYRKMKTSVKTSSPPTNQRPLSSKIKQKCVLSPLSTPKSQNFNGGYP